MELKQTLKVKELIRILQVEYEMFSADFFGTPGRTDTMVFHSRADKMALISSMFEYDGQLSYDKVHR